MTKRYNKTITVVEVEQYDSSDFPEEVTVIGLIGWLNKYLEQVPVEFRDVATAEIAATDRYGSSYATINIAYVRPETDAEMIDRHNIEVGRTRQSEANARAQYEALRARFG